MLQANIEILKAIAKIRNGFLDALMLFLTEFGTEIVVIGVVCTLYWCANKKLAYRIGMIFFASGILVQGLKVGFHIERPWVLDKTFEPVAAAKPGATGYSFPSGHTQGAAALYGTLFTAWNKRWFKILCAAMIVTVAFTRLYLGVHTPLDVVVSAAVTLGCVWVFGKVADALERGNSRDFDLCMVLSALALLLCVFSFVLAEQGIVESEHINDCFKSGGAGLAFAIGWYLERRYLNFSVRTNKLWKQIVKMVIGVGITLALKSGLKLIAPDNLIVDFTRYFCTVFWVIFVYPLLFNRFSLKDEVAGDNAQ